MSDFQSNLLTGLAVLLDAQSLGTYRASGAYESTETAIVVGQLPQEPDRVIALMCYPVEDDPALSDSIIGVRIRTRWGGLDLRAVQDLSDLIFKYLQGKHQFTLSTNVHVVYSERNSGGPIGQDTSNRWEWSDNYYLTVWRPSTYRT